MNAPETLTEKQVKEHLAGSPMQTTLKLVLVGIGARIYKRESDGLFHLLDNGKRDEP